MDPLRHREGEREDPVRIIEVMMIDWDPRQAKHRYTYLIHHEWRSGYRECISEFSGDLDWAERTAIHNNIDELPGEEDVQWLRTTPYAR